jgi:hypothetical protein
LYSARSRDRLLLICPTSEIELDFGERRGVRPTEIACAKNLISRGGSVDSDYPMPLVTKF